MRGNTGLVGNKFTIMTTGAFVPKTGDCGSPYAWLYLFVFIAVCRVCLIPLFTATVVSAVLENIDDQRSIVRWEELVIFLEEWQKMDVLRTGQLPRWKVTKFLENLHKRHSVLVGMRTTTHHLGEFKCQTVIEMPYPGLECQVRLKVETYT